jgi:RNA 2',3'-cyclic 3'-phosphodiesterase
MRLFIAIEIAPEIRDRLTALISEFRPKLANAAWVRPEGLHITLKFLGNVSDEKRSTIEAGLGIVKAAQFSLSIASVGVFPNPRSPRVVWAGIESGPELAALAAKIEEALNPLGFEREKRAFSPHVTLARFKSSGNKLELAKLLSARASEGTGSDVRAFGTMAATHFHLYESKLSPQGARYSKLASFALQ